MNTSLIVLSSFLLFVNLFLFYRLLKKGNSVNLVKENEELKEKLTVVSKEKDEIIKNIFSKSRKGVVYKETTIENGTIYGKTTVYIEEIEKYKNGYSKVKIIDIESISNTSDFNNERVNNFVRDNFVSLIKTDKVEWLEIEEDIMEQRKNKLKQILENE
jgi:hypothetical protein